MGVIYQPTKANALLSSPSFRFNKPFSSFGKTGNDTEDSSNELISNEERMLIIHRLHELLRPFMLRRVKSEVLDQLPQKVEKVIRCELSAWQKELYKQISVKIADEATKSNFSRGLNNVVMQLRKVCNHPFLFNNEGSNALLSSPSFRFNKPFSSFGKTGNDTEDSSNELISNEERMLIIHRLHELLRPFMLRRVKSEVLDQLPQKVEKVIRCELSAWQKELYKQISVKIADEATKSNFSRGLNNVVMQLRKVCNHPFLFNNEGYHINEDIIRTSGKVELLDRMLPKLKAAGHRVLMFTQMTKMMPILEDYFAFRGFSSLRLDGSTSADEREKRMYMFNAPDSPYFIFLLSTRAGGLGLNLATADTVIIFDSDWNPMMDLQAQDRAHRIGQRKDVRVFRIITQTPVEEKILSRATEKLQMNELVVEAGKFDKSGQAKEDNSLERLKMMELLLTDFDETQNTQGTATAEANFESTDTDDGDADEEQEDSKNLFNEMICTNDDDYKMYCKMDLERTNAPELYTDINTAPDWVRYPGGKPKEGEEFIDPSQPEILGKRRAAAGDIKYDDGLTEKQFCRMMDKKHIADEKAMKKKAKGKKRNHKDLDVDPSLILDYDGGGRKRSKAEQFEVDTLLQGPSQSLEKEATAMKSLLPYKNDSIASPSLSYTSRIRPRTASFLKYFWRGHAPKLIPIIIKLSRNPLA